MMTTGISTDDLSKVKIWYPSMRAVKGHKMGNGNYRVVIVDLIGVRSHTDSTKLKYRVLIDLDSFPNSVPGAFVMFPDSDSIEHVNIGHGATTGLAPNRKICSICLGSIGGPFSTWPQSSVERLRGFMNHLEHVLNTPNTGSRMRG